MILNTYLGFILEDSVIHPLATSWFSLQPRTVLAKMLMHSWKSTNSFYVNFQFRMEIRHEQEQEMGHLSNLFLFISLR